jgi:dTDP-4-amino-4,6-dideoxyglucose
MSDSTRVGTQLAILGGDPRFTEKLHVGRPNVPDRGRLLARIEGVLDRLWLTNGGPLVQEFEQRVAELAGTRHAIATCNGTLALEVMTQAAGLSGEVIVPSFTFVATAHALRWHGITPVFADVDPRTATIDPAHVRALITPRTTGILGVHLWGYPCADDELRAIADEHGIVVLYDAAHATGCSYRGRRIGRLGTASAFSFHATKFVNCFEGGAVVTDDDELAARVRALHNFGTGVDHEIGMAGTNAKMTEVAAAMGLTALEEIDRLIAVNRGNHERYRAGLAGLPGIRLREPAPDADVNYQYIVVDIDAASAGLGRDAVMAALHAENVMAKSYFHPGCHRLEPYRTHQGLHTPMPLPHTEALAASTLVLPSGTAVTHEQIDEVCALITRTVEQAPAIRAALAPVPA